MFFLVYPNLKSLFQKVKEEDEPEEEDEDEMGHAETYAEYMPIKRMLHLMSVCVSFEILDRNLIGLDTF